MEQPMEKKHGWRQVFEYKSSLQADALLQGSWIDSLTLFMQNFWPCSLCVMYYKWYITELGEFLVFL